MAEKVKRLGPLPLVHDPGQCWTYGLSSDVAGRMIEVVSSQSLDRYLTRCVFDPVGMKCTYFVVPAEQRARLVPAHARDGDKLVVPPWSRDGGPRYLSGGGGLHTTVGDYSRFVQLLLGGCVSVVSRESINSMTRNQIGDLTTPFGFKYGLSLGIATSEVSGISPLPVGGVGWYGIYSYVVLDVATSARRCAVLRQRSGSRDESPPVRQTRSGHRRRDGIVNHHLGSG